jgi:copper chaperone CopZ
MRIEKALKDAGFKKVVIDLDTKTVTIELGKKTVEDAKLAVTKIGYNFQEL